jgi:hypothetical protein
VTTANVCAIKCIATNGTDDSLEKSLTVTKLTAACRLAPETPVADKFSVIAYPNPSCSEFTLDVQSLSKRATGIQVNDIAGRLIENR